jgi:hypothetical protein
VLALGRPGVPSGIADLPAFLDYMEAGGGPDRPEVVLLCSNVPGDRGLALGRRLRGLALGCDTAVVDLHTPGVVLELTARVCAGMAPVVAAELLPDLARRIAAAAMTAAILDDVSKLRNPSPTLTQHARSWLPGSLFAVTPQRQVVSGRDAVRAAWQEAVAAAGPIRLAATSGGTAVAEHLRSLPPDTEVVEQADDGRNGYWGARTWLELCWLQEAPQAIAEQLARTPVAQCTNCGRRNAGPVCSFCAAATRHIPRRQEAEAQ